MNLHALVSPAIARINPMQTATLKRSDGYDMGAAFRQQPRYITVPDVRIQVQPLSSGDLRRLEAQNIQGVARVVYLYGQAHGVVKPLGKGGDLLMFDGLTWLVTVVFEAWPSWCKVGVTLQDDAP